MAMSELDSLRDQMRTDLNRIVSARLANGEWTKADADEVGEAIRATLNSGDRLLISQWAGWCKTTAATYHVPMPIPQIRPAHVCTTCAHLTRVGKSDPGYCAQPIDTPFAYCPGNHLRRLPDDRGSACQYWNP
jgi:hypothetical protein